MTYEVHNLAVNFGVQVPELFALFLDPLGDLFAFFSVDGSDGLASDAHGFRFLRHGRSPTPLLATLLGRFFRALLLGFPALLFLSHRRMWDNAKARRQTLVLALFFSPFNVDINIVRVAPFLLELATLPPEAALVEALAVNKLREKQQRLGGRKQERKAKSLELRKG